MVDWTLADGTSVRIEVEKIYCANCGKAYGWVPKENTTWACFLCTECFERWGAVAGAYAIPNNAFWEAVAYECLDRFGYIPTEEELMKLKDGVRLGSALEKLEKESPIKV